MAFSYLTEVVLIYHFRLNSNPDLRLGDVTTVNWTVTEVQILPSPFFHGYLCWHCLKRRKELFMYKCPN